MLSQLAWKSRNVPTWSAEPRFNREFWKLSADDQARLRRVVADLVRDLKAGSAFSPGLRVKRVQGTKSVFELTWAPDGRATFEFAQPIHNGEAHVIWRRCGGHEIFADP